MEDKIKLSGGMQRKLEIIRSLIHTPSVLFLDEPTQGLDAVSHRILWEYINNVRKEHGTTVFLTTHYIDEAEHVETEAANPDTVCFPIGILLLGMTASTFLVDGNKEPTFYC